jgi:hypothetical protein
VTSKEEIIEVDLQPYLAEAQQRAITTGALKLSMRGIQANQVGALGELVGMDHLRNCGIEFQEIFSTAYDIRFLHNGLMKTLEFKTKERTVSPEDFYDCTVPKYNHSHQRPDYYLFISLLAANKSDDISRFKKAYILGSIDRERFDQSAKLWTPRQTDSSNGWVPTIECLNVPVSQLDKPKEGKTNASIFAK